MYQWEELHAVKTKEHPQLGHLRFLGLSAANLDSHGFFSLCCGKCWALTLQSWPSSESRIRGRFVEGTWKKLHNSSKSRCSGRSTSIQRPGKRLLEAGDGTEGAWMPNHQPVIYYIQCCWLYRLYRSCWWYAISIHIHVLTPARTPHLWSPSQPEHPHSHASPTSPEIAKASQSPRARALLPWAATKPSPQGNLEIHLESMQHGNVGFSFRQQILIALKQILGEWTIAFRKNPKNWAELWGRDGSATNAVCVKSHAVAHVSTSSPKSLQFSPNPFFPYDKYQLDPTIFWIDPSHHPHFWRLTLPRCSSLNSPAGLVPNFASTISFPIFRGNT